MRPLPIRSASLASPIRWWIAHQAIVDRHPSRLPNARLVEGANFGRRDGAAAAKDSGVFATGFIEQLTIWVILCVAVLQVRATAWSSEWPGPGPPWHLIVAEMVTSAPRTESADA